ncbi:MAG: agmatinase [Bacteroidetes bacterium]|nr:agmatinase [Bacteroidota bacterium]
MKQYGDLPKKYTDFENSKVVIVPVPYDGTSTWLKGADKGPQALLEASANMEVYDVETDSEVHKVGIHTMSSVTENSSPEAMVEAVNERVKELLKKKKFPIVIGGEHSVSIGAIKAMAANFNDLTILQLDAHADMRQEYEGSKNNHACVMARAKEVAPVVQVGIRSMSVEEREDIQPDRVFYASHIHEQRTWMFEFLNKLTRNVYITIDLDVFDPSIMPSTGTPEPGGLLWYQVLDILKAVSEKVNIVGFDVVELKPGKENRSPDFLASKLIYTLLTYKYITGIK